MFFKSFSLFLAKGPIIIRSSSRNKKSKNRIAIQLKKTERKFLYEFYALPFPTVNPILNAFFKSFVVRDSWRMW